MKQLFTIAFLLVALAAPVAAQDRHTSPLAPPATRAGAEPARPRAEKPPVVTREMLDDWLHSGVAEVAVVESDGRITRVAPVELERRADAVHDAYAEGRAWWYGGSFADLASSAIGFTAGLTERGVIGHGTAGVLVITLNAAATVIAERIINHYHRKHPLDPKYGTALRRAGKIRAFVVAPWNIVAIAVWGGRKR